MDLFQLTTGFYKKMENGLFSSSVKTEVSRNQLASDEFISKCCGEVSYNIGSDWLRWGRHLGLSDSDLDNIGSDNKNCYEKADNVFKKWKQKNGNPSWEQLKKELMAFNRLDIVIKIETKFRETSSSSVTESSSLKTKFLLLAVLTLVISLLFKNISYSFFWKNSKSDLSRSSAELKKYYFKYYWKINEHQLLIKSSVDVDLNQKFVDLCIVDAVNAQVERSKAAVLSVERNKFLEKQMNYTPIQYSEIFTKEKSVLLISGIAGIGKTWLLRKCLLDWSNGLIWKNIELVFYLECRRLNQYSNISNINELLNVFYKDIVNFNISSHTALFIIDGLDEFHYFNELLNPSLTCNYPIVNVLAEILKYNHVIAGRVYAIDQYQSISTEYSDKLTVQIMGFNENGINNYVENHVMEEKKKVIKTILKESPIAKAMASVPFYLSSMCKIINDSKDMGLNSFLTMTDLYANIFLYFIRKHIFKNNKFVYEIIEDSSNKKYILNICKIAYKMFVNNKIVFSKKEIHAFIGDLDKNEDKYFGFIEKIETDLGSYYQFAHLTIMEFCASVYAYNYLSSYEIMVNEKLKSCLSMICGLANKNQNSLIMFLGNLNPSKKSHEESLILYSVLDRLRKSDDRKDYHDFFIECFYESQSSFNDEIKSIVDEQDLWWISIVYGKTSYLTSCENYFINHYVKSGRKLWWLRVEKNILSDEEKKLLIQCSTNVRKVSFNHPINFEGWKPKDTIEMLMISISRYLITKKDFEENFLPWINLCKELYLELHDDIDFIKEFYKWIRCSNVKKFSIRYRGKDFENLDEFRNFTTR
ncbi:NACHT, LRR and PYD domains-containing protein 3 isoform X2 [Hydra vulgaris]|uniref:NACHT, LRR and PYD domains-containing protein 3 isoform X2 n=1 Tax=Hydra vulgaris TaxID=6087 RepID=UPI001F5FA0FB|nr:NACHT, LRR and PYD domains-containing protein 3-like isoform X2 [Hydra vulgaris]